MCLHVGWLVSGAKKSSVCSWRCNTLFVMRTGTLWYIVLLLCTRRCFDSRKVLVHTVSHKGFASLFKAFAHNSVVLREKYAVHTLGVFLFGENTKDRTSGGQAEA